MSIFNFGGKKKRVSETWDQRTMFGAGLNFAVSEAYKLLRTNIQFSFSEEGKGHVVGITSSIQAEGKSSSAANMAYAMAEDGFKVLFMDCDLRRPSIASKLSLARSPGLTNLLVSKGDYRDVIQKCAAAPKLDIIAAGDIPPNPSELLGSNRMLRLLEELREVYDYIFVDLPPVTVVSDTLAMARALDGVIVVVRGGMAEQKVLAEAMRQLKLVNVRVLGFVYRDSEVIGRKYAKHSKKYKYRYYKNYRSGEPAKSKEGKEQPRETAESDKK